MDLLASVLQAASVFRSVRGPYYLGVGSISDSLSLSLSLADSVYRYRLEGGFLACFEGGLEGLG